VGLKLPARWLADGLPAVASYWRAFFAAEPGADVAVERKPDRVVVEVRVCPAIRHLRAGGRVVVREYCRHCYHMGNARAETAGMAMRLEGGNGSCRHTYFAAGAESGLLTDLLAARRSALPAKSGG